MTLDELKDSEHVTGIKQVTKCLKRGAARKLYLAHDAETGVIEPLRELAHECGLEPDESASMQELGRACGIKVDAAAAAILK